MTLTKTLRITPADQAANPYYYIPFDVPAGTTRVDVTLSYPKADDCVIDLGCFDPGMRDFPSPTGFRGWSGGFRDRFFVATDDATPGYIHGAMPAGTWNVILGLYKVPLQGADVTVTITLDASPRATNPPPGWPLPPAVLELILQSGRFGPGNGLPSTFTYLNLGSVRQKGVAHFILPRVIPS